MKRTIILLLIIVGLGVGWVFGWGLVERKVVDTAETVKTRLAERGQRFDCADQLTGGFPFRISFNCSSVSYFNERTGIAFSAGEMRSAAQAYQPGKAVIELESPARVVAPDGQSFQSEWASLRSSIGATFEGLDEFSVLVKEMSVTPERRPGDAVNFEEFQLNGRKVGSQRVQFAFRSENVSDAQSRWPVFDARALVSIDGVYDELSNRPDLLTIARRDGLDGEINRLEYRPESGGSLVLSGPAQITPQGILSGRFKLKISNTSKLLEALEQGLPGYSQELQRIGSTIQRFGGSLGEREFEFPVTVRDGSVIVGLIKVAEIPPLY